MSEQIKWGQIWGDDDRLHLVPCDERCYLLPPHKTNENCACHPEVEEEAGIVIHAVIH